jgi:acyl homoserine lactone synthase
MKEASVIYILSQENAHEHGDALPSMHRLRYRAFIQRQSYNVYSIRKMEYDTYDTLAAVYAIWKDTEGLVRGCTRMAPTDRPYMIKDLWPNLVKDEELPSDDNIWEASRFCIDKDLTPELRKRVHIELVYAMQEFCLYNKIYYLIGVMQPRIWKRVFIDIGWPITFLGEPSQRPGETNIVAGRMPISADILENIQNRFSLPISIIHNLDKAHLNEVA